MAQVDIRINERDYRITCDDGQEERLTRLAGFFGEYVNELSTELGQIGDARLMLLSALTVCDELFELRRRVADLETAGESLDSDTVGAAGKAVEAAAARVREISSTLEPASAT